MLSQNGVTPRTAQAAMRHSKIDLTMNVYTDPRLLDVAGAMNALPSFPLNSSPRTSEAVAATGTAGSVDSKPSGQLAPNLAPTLAHRGHSESFPVNLGKIDEPTTGKPDRAKNIEKPTKKGSFSAFENEPLKRPRRDLNPQPPDRQSGALTN